MPSFDMRTRGPMGGLAPALLGVLALCLMLVPTASAAPNWLGPGDLSNPGRNSDSPSVVMDDSANTVAIWDRQNVTDANYTAQISTRSAGGSFTAPVDFVSRGTEPQLAISPSGEVVAAWKRLDLISGLYTIQVATRPPGGSFSAPDTAFMAPVKNVIPQELQVAIGTGGDVALTWSRIDPSSGFDKITCSIDPGTGFPIKCPNPSFVEATVRPAGGSFEPARRISAPRGIDCGCETPEQKENREKIESKRTAGGARPAVDAAGNTTVVWSAFDDVDYVIQTAERPAGGEFSAPVQVSESGGNAVAPDIGVDAGGNVIASWMRQAGSNRAVQAAIKPPRAAFALLGDVSDGSGLVERPVLKVSQGGTAVLTWLLPGTSQKLLQASTRLPGGAFSPPLIVNSGKDNPQYQELAIDSAGDTVVAWSGDNGATEIVRAAVRPAGASIFGAPVAISQSSATDLFHPQLAMDASGNATVVWLRSNGSNTIVQWAGYDAVPPEVRNLSVPGLATVAETAQFSASAFDVWQVGAPSFDFGDGVQASGNAVSHVYSAPGRYTVRATATDAVGRATTSSATILVKARNFFTIGKLKKNRRKGTATLAVTIPEPGALVATGKGIKKTTLKSAKGGTVKLRLKAAGKGLKRLNRKGKLRSRLKVAYSPVGGDTNAKRRRVALSKKLP